MKISTHFSFTEKLHSADSEKTKEKLPDEATHYNEPNGNAEVCELFSCQNALLILPNDSNGSLKST